MIRSISGTITRVANSEVTETVIGGLATPRRRIDRIWAEVVADTILVAYVDQDKIVEVHLEVDQATYLGIPVDRVLDEGETLKVGFVDESGGAAPQEYTVFIEEG